MPMQEYSSAGKTFSMSRWAMMLPIVARRSPAIRTPPVKVAATIVVPCGASTVPRGRQPSTSGQQPRGVLDQEVGERRVRHVGEGGVEPPGVWSVTARHGLLSALLHEAAYELLGVLLE